MRALGCGRGWGGTGRWKAGHNFLIYIFQVSKKRVVVGEGVPPQRERVAICDDCGGVRGVTEANVAGRECGRSENLPP